MTDSKNPPELEHVPPEIWRHLYWAYYSPGTHGVKEVRFFDKSDFDRSTAWASVEKEIEFNPDNPRESNPWRKAHTENFWVWVIPNTEKKDD